MTKRVTSAASARTPGEDEDEDKHEADHEDEDKYQAADEDKDEAAEDGGV